MVSPHCSLIHRWLSLDRRGWLRLDWHGWLNLDWRIQRPFVGLYERVFERTKIKMKGYVAVQRKLLTLIYALWKKDEKYEGRFVSAQQKKVAPTEGTTLHQPELAVLNEVNMEELVES